MESNCVRQSVLAQVMWVHGVKELWDLEFYSHHETTMEYCSWEGEVMAKMGSCLLH